MKGLLALIGVAAALVLAAASAGATVTVTISKNGYVPKATTIAAGDTIHFTNSDTVVHQVVFKSTTGVTCTPNPLVLQPGQSGNCTFATAGKYTYNDPNVKGGAFQGTVTVNAATAGALTLQSAPQLVVFGGHTSVSGKLASGQAGQNVQVLAQQCGAGPAKAIGSATTAAGGTFTLSVQPLQNTVYSAKLKGATSNTTPVQVRPRLRLGKTAPHHYSVRLFANVSLAGKVVSFQRYRPALRRWTRVRAVTLGATKLGVAPTVISAATFKSTIRRGVRVRAAIPQAQAGGCYLGGISNTIRS